MKFKCMECLKEGAWWDLFSVGEEGGTLRSYERHGLDLCKKSADTKECFGCLASVTVPFSMLASPRSHLHQEPH